MLTDKEIKDLTKGAGYVLAYRNGIFRASTGKLKGRVITSTEIKQLDKRINETANDR